MTRNWLLRGSIVLGLFGGVAGLRGWAQELRTSNDGPLERPADPPKGTGLILGRVVEGDTDRPVADAVVTLSLTTTGSGLFSSTLPSVSTDAQGRFVIRDAPAASFSVWASKIGYIEGANGRRWPAASDRGQPFILGDGERTSSLTIRMWKFAAIGGTVNDERGDPVVGITVRALTRRIVGGRPAFGDEYQNYSATTDDRGIFRLSSLAPGDYVITVPVVVMSLPKSRSGPSPPTDPYPLPYNFYSGTGSAMDVGDTKFSMMNPMTLGRGSFSPSLAGVTADGRVLMYETQFFPGATSVSAATVLSIGSGEDRSNIDFQMRGVPAVRVSGTLTGPEGPIGGTGLRLLSANTASMSADSETGATVSEADGHFTFLGVTAGQYTISVARIPRITRAAADVISSETTVRTAGGTSGSTIIIGGPQGAAPEDPAWWADVPVTVADRDVVDLTVSLRQGFRIAGRVEFTGTSAKPTPGGLRWPYVTIERTDGQRSTNSTPFLGRIDAQGRLSSLGVPPAQYFLRVAAGPPGWNFKSAMQGDRDLSIVPLELTGDVDGIVITFTDQPLASLSGSATDDRGQPDPNATVVMFPTDRQLWTNTGATPRNIRATGVSAKGQYAIANLPAAEYFVVASSQIPQTWADPEILDTLSRTATRVRIAENEKRVLDLKSLRRVGGAPVEVDVESCGVMDERQAPQTRDVTRLPPGTSVISGVIVHDDAARKPMARAHVVLTGSAAFGGSRALITDETGRFAFTALPAGRYSVSASKPAYLGISYGAKRSGGAGTSIVLPEGQQLTDITLALSKGGVIAGVVKDEGGQPQNGLSVRLQQYRYLPTGERQLGSVGGPSGSTTTDDRGMYRFYGLAPGEYFLSASARFGTGSTSVHPTSTADVQYAQAMLQGRPGGAAPAGSRPASSAHPSTRAYAPVFFPGTTSQANAHAVKIAIGEERTDANFAIRMVPTSWVEGTVTNPSGPLPGNLEIRLVSVEGAAPGGGDMLTGLPVRPKADGKFSFSGVSPGAYVVAASMPAPSGRGAAASSANALWATSDVVINGTDISGVALSLQPAMTLSGKLVYDTKIMAPPADLSTVRVSLAPQLSGSQISIGQLTVNASKDGTFTLAGLMPGRYTLRSQVSVADARLGWMLKASLVNGRDAADDPFEIKGGENITDATIVFSDQACELNGTLSDATGRPATDYFIVTFPVDQTLWKSRRIVQARPASDGNFVVRNLQAGAYLVAAITDLDMTQLYDPAFLSQLVPGAITVTLADGEKKTQDIRGTYPFSAGFPQLGTGLLRGLSPTVENLWERGTSPYSRSAFAGSADAARRAGSAAAATAVTTSTSTALPMTRGSRALTSKSCVVSDFVASIASGTPNTNPTTVCTSAPRITSMTIRRPCWRQVPAPG